MYYNGPKEDLEHQYHAASRGFFALPNLISRHNHIRNNKKSTCKTLNFRYCCAIKLPCDKRVKFGDQAISAVLRVIVNSTAKKPSRAFSSPSNILLRDDDHGDLPYGGWNRMGLG